MQKIVEFCKKIMKLRLYLLLKAQKTYFFKFKYLKVRNS